MREVKGENRAWVGQVASLYCLVLGFCVMLYVLYLARGLLVRQQPSDFERHLAMVSFLVLAPVLIGQNLPVAILPSLTVFFAAYLRKAG